MITQLQKWIEETDNIVFFGGAGVSTESGIPDFRSVDGLYNMKYKFPPEIMLSHTFFVNNTEDFFFFFFKKMLYLSLKLFTNHIKLAELETKGKLKAIVTQNIDGLHSLAGSKNVYELHGCVNRNYCVDCHKFYSVEHIINSKGVPKCECGGVVKPDVVLYEEGLDDAVMDNSLKAISEADILIIGGTSLNVYPAAGLINYYTGKKLVLINKTPTGMDSKANIVFADSLGNIFTQL
jgi:NAD-dependent deacetylase